LEPNPTTLREGKVSVSLISSTRSVKGKRLIYNNILRMVINNSSHNKTNKKKINHQKERQLKLNSNKHLTNEDFIVNKNIN